MNTCFPMGGLAWSKKILASHQFLYFASILFFVHGWYCFSSFCFCFSMLSIPSLGYSLSSHSLHLCFNNRFNCLMCVLDSFLKIWWNHNSLLELNLYSLFYLTHFHRPSFFNFAQAYFMQDITLTTPNPDHFVEGKNNQMMWQKI